MLSHLRKNTVLWALASPLPLDFLLGKVPTISRLLDGDELRAFIFSQVAAQGHSSLIALLAMRYRVKDPFLSKSEGNGQVLLGIRDKNATNSFFGRYLHFCSEVGFESPTPYKFGENTPSILQSVGITATQKRVRKGISILGIETNPQNPVKPLAIPDLDDIRKSHWQQRKDTISVQPENLPNVEKHDLVEEKKYIQG
jgi:hypothetical protein